MSEGQESRPSAVAGGERPVPGDAALRSVRRLYRRLRRWFGARPWVVDLAVAFAVLLYELPVSMYPRLLDGPVSLAFSITVSVAMCALYPLHRRHPLGVFCGIAAGAWIGVVLGWALLPAPMVLFALMLHHLGTRFSWRVLAPAMVVVAAWWAVASVPYLRAEWTRSSQIALVICANVLIGLSGALVRSRRARLRALEDRAARLERERDARARIAAAEERARIARELHDIVSHSLGTMTVMADGASRVAEADPQRGSRMMARVRDTGRDAMTDMRRMLNVLRSDDPAAREPQPGLAQLEQLLDTVRATGVRVDLAVEGERTGLAPGVDLAAYRIVQEALTNARKHGGPMLSRVEVSLTHRRESLELRISDDGRGADTLREGAGHGIVGMRERAAAYDGSLRLGPRPGGGLEVRALLSLGPVESGAGPAEGEAAPAESETEPAEDGAQPTEDGAAPAGYEAQTSGHGTEQGGREAERDGGER